MILTDLMYWELVICEDTLNLLYWRAFFCLKNHGNIYSWNEPAVHLSSHSFARVHKTRLDVCFVPVT